MYKQNTSLYSYIVLLSGDNADLSWTGRSWVQMKTCLVCLKQYSCRLSVYARFFSPLCLCLRNCLLVFFIISLSGIQLPAVINTRPLSVSFSFSLSLQLLAPRWDVIVINSGVTRGHKTLVMMEKQTNKTDEIKWWKHVRHLITDANCFRVGGERGRGGERCTWGEGKRNLRISSLRLACAWLQS